MAHEEGLHASRGIFPPLSWGAEQRSDLNVLRLLTERAEKPRRIAIPVFHQFTDYVAAASEIAITLGSLGHQCFFLPWSATESSLSLYSKSRLLTWNPRFSGSPDRRAAQILRESGVEGLHVVAPPKPRRDNDRRTDPDKWIRLTQLRAGSADGAGSLGPLIASELSDRLRWNPDDAEVRLSYVEQLAAEQNVALANLTEAVRTCQADTVLMFNGRFFLDEVISSVARSEGLDVLRYEAGGDLRGYDVFTHSAHDREALQQRMVPLIEVVRNDPRARALGASWFEARVGMPESTPAQPAAASSTAEFIAFFTSSPDEFYLVDPDDAKGYLSQLDAIRAVRDSLAAIGNPELVVRTHPNMRYKSPLERKVWSQSLSGLSGIRVIDEEQRVDSYELARRSTWVITYGSTIGVEAMYMGRPTMTMGPSLYSSLIDEPVARSAADLRLILTHPQPVDENRVLAYGLFMQVRGFPYLNYERRGHGTGRLLGRPLPRFGRLSNFVPGIDQRLHTRRVRRHNVRPVA